MARKIVVELNQLDEKALQLKVEEWRRELFGLRLNASTAHVKDYSRFAKLRRSVARGLTLLTQKQMGNIVADAQKGKE